MKTTRYRRSLLAAAAASVFLAHAASADLSTPPSSGTWAWPLYVNQGGVKGKPRPAVYTNHEYQRFNDTWPIDPHPGIDAMGQPNDIAAFPHAGRLVFASRPNHYTKSGTHARLWVDADPYLFYVGHMMDSGTLATDPELEKVRAFVDAAFDLMARDPAAPNPDDPLTLPKDALPILWARNDQVSQGEVAGALSDWTNIYHFHHVHLGIYDKNDRFASLDPLFFLAHDAQGVVGDSLHIADDENPTINDLTVVADPGVTPGSTAATGTLCGFEVHGSADIVLDATDTFYTTLPTPDPFDAQTFNVHNTVDIYGASYSVTQIGTRTRAVQQKQWYESPLGCLGTQCGLWRLRNGASRTLNTLADWFQDRGWAKPPEYVGDAVNSRLWLTSSTMDHTLSSTLPVHFYHVISNGMREDSSPTDDDAWRTEGLDGRYVITATAWDQAGNKASKSTFAFVNGQNHQQIPPSGTAGFTSVFIQDHAGDLGQIPSNQGGEPFWASDDILVVEHGVQPDCDNGQGRGTPLIVGNVYDVYVRVHNNGCTSASVNGVVLYSAVPSSPLSGLKPLRDTYQGSATIPALGGKECIGPIAWEPKAEDLDGEQWGHRCLLAAVDAVGDPGPVPSTVASWVPQDDDNIAQRNVQFDALNFVIRNDHDDARSSNIEIDLDPKYPLDGTDTYYFDLYVEDTDGLTATWQQVDPTIHSASEDGRTYAVVRVKTGKVVLTGWNLEGQGQRWAKAKYALPDDSGPFTVNVYHVLGGETRGGMVFKVSGANVPIIK